ncbi:MAG: 4-hydroxy-tetrahydrodipicolinate synthase [Fusobacteriaceae bacterium]|nr:4-hydroxy-tetrahydrodipicolinate synthase [Fusobacteriaceae bacterium]
MSIFVGSGVALVTPFNEDKTVNYEKLKELIEFQIKNSTDAIVVTGTTGEGSTLSDLEQKEIISQTVKIVNKRVPVIAGTGSNDTKHAIELSQQAENLGADGLLVITPYYNRTNKRGLIEHFKAIANSVKIPIILYNVPGRTGMNIPLDVYGELKDIKNIVGVKDACGDLTYAMNIMRLYGDRFDLYSGNDDIILPIMAVGGKGVISVLANVMPKETHDIVYDYINKNIEKSKEMQLKLNGFVHSLFIETNPIPVKAALNLVGCNVGGYRAPLYEMSKEALEALKEEMKKINLI